LKESHPSASATGAFGKATKTVLIIDDETLVRATVARMVEREGHRVLQASNGVEGLNIFSRERVDLVVCDIIMPEKEGIETIGELRRKNPTLKIIAISGGGRTENVDFLGMAQRLGADYVLAKPFGRDEFTALLRKSIEDIHPG
jgi:DNA-binding response OmpR family regulator